MAKPEEKKKRAKGSHDTDPVKGLALGSIIPASVLAAKAASSGMAGRKVEDFIDKKKAKVTRKLDQLDRLKASAKDKEQLREYAVKKREEIKQEKNKTAKQISKKLKENKKEEALLAKLKKKNPNDPEIKSVERRIKANKDIIEGYKSGSASRIATKEKAISSFLDASHKRSLANRLEDFRTAKEWKKLDNKRRKKMERELKVLNKIEDVKSAVTDPIKAAGEKVADKVSDAAEYISDKADRAKDKTKMAATNLVRKAQGKTPLSEERYWRRDQQETKDRAQKLHDLKNKKTAAYQAVNAKPIERKVEAPKGPEYKTHPMGSLDRSVPGKVVDKRIKETPNKNVKVEGKYPNKPVTTSKTYTKTVTAGVDKAGASKPVKLTASGVKAAKQLAKNNAKAAEAARRKAEKQAQLKEIEKNQPKVDRVGTMSKAEKVEAEAAAKRTLAKVENRKPVTKSTPKPAPKPAPKSVPKKPVDVPPVIPEATNNLKRAPHKDGVPPVLPDSNMKRAPHKDGVPPVLSESTRNIKRAPHKDGVPPIIADKKADTTTANRLRKADARVAALEAKLTKQKEAETAAKNALRKVEKQMQLRDIEKNQPKVDRIQPRVGGSAQAAAPKQSFYKAVEPKRPTLKDLDFSSRGYGAPKYSTGPVKAPTPSLYSGPAYPFAKAAGTEGLKKAAVEGAKKAASKGWLSKLLSVGSKVAKPLAGIGSKFLGGPWGFLALTAAPFILNKMFGDDEEQQPAPAPQPEPVAPQNRELFDSVDHHNRLIQDLMARTYMNAAGSSQPSQLDKILENIGRNTELVSQENMGLRPALRRANQYMAAQNLADIVNRGR